MKVPNKCLKQQETAKKKINRKLIFCFIVIIKQHFNFTHIFMWVRKLEPDSFTETKNWSGKNEIIETSARLHPLWSQNKRLHTPWTKDHMHTRQNKWIQTELAFTLAKNAIRSNPYEIILLQTTRKENNWKTEETLARIVVTLAMERIKGSNPWCLWWWWIIINFDGRNNLIVKKILLKNRWHIMFMWGNRYNTDTLCCEKIAYGLYFI